jgi:hypothetical protein
MGKAFKITLVAFVVLAASAFMFWDTPRNAVAMFLEKDTIEQTAHAYFKAEMNKDFPQVYALLAPSSDYRKKHTYETFLNDISQYPPAEINTYEIVRIHRLRDNDNRENYPGVEKFVQVEVDVTFTTSGPNNVYNYSFTFLKEKGSWYKG